MRAQPEPTGVVEGRRPMVRRIFHMWCFLAVALTGGLFFGLQHAAQQTGLLIAVAVGQLAIAGTWSYGTRTVGLPGSAVVIALVALGCDIYVLDAKSIHFGVLGPVLAGSIIAAILHQVTRRPPRRRVFSSMAQDVFGAAIAGSMSLWLMLPHVGNAHLLVAAISLGVGAALLVSHLIDSIGAAPRVSYDVPRGVFGVILAVGAGAWVTAWRLGTINFSDVLGHAIIGGVVALVCILVSLALTFIAVDAAPRMWASVILHSVVPFAVAAPVGLVITLAIAL